MLRQADLLQLVQIASTYPSRERFLTELTLDPPDATSDRAGAPLLDEDYLILSTIHSAKGQEWKSVYVLNVVDGCMRNGNDATELLPADAPELAVGPKIGILKDEAVPMNWPLCGATGCFLERKPGETSTFVEEVLGGKIT